jgi:hypothetical protein
MDKVEGVGTRDLSEPMFLYRYDFILRSSCSFTTKMEAEGFSETFVTIYLTTRSIS